MKLVLLSCKSEMISCVLLKKHVFDQKFCRLTRKTRLNYEFIRATYDPLRWKAMKKKNKNTQSNLLLMVNFESITNFNLKKKTKTKKYLCYFVLASNSHKIAIFCWDRSIFQFKRDFFKLEIQSVCTIFQCYE